MGSLGGPGGNFKSFLCFELFMIMKRKDSKVNDDRSTSMSIFKILKV